MTIAVMLMRVLLFTGSQHGGWSRGSYRPWNGHRGSRGRYWMNIRDVFFDTGNINRLKALRIVSERCRWSDNGQWNIFLLCRFSSRTSKSMLLNAACLRRPSAYLYEYRTRRWIKQR